MTYRLQIILIIIIILAIILLINGIRQRRMDLRYGLPWLTLGIALLIIAIFPDITGFLARLLGISLPINMLFLLGLGFILILIFGLTSSVSKMADRQKVLVQKIAILEKELEDMKKTTDNEIIDNGLIDDSTLNNTVVEKNNS